MAVDFLIGAGCIAWFAYWRYGRDAAILAVGACFLLHVVAAYLAPARIPNEITVNVKRDAATVDAP